MKLTPSERPARRMMIFGHRGSPRRFEENSAASLASAVEEGADGFECDLRRLSDGAVVLYHDDRIYGTTVEELDASTLRVHVPTLAEAAVALQIPAFTVLEVKRTGWEEQLAALVPHRDRLIVSSFDHRLPARLKKLRPDVDTGIVLSGYLLGAGAYARAASADWLFPEHRYVDADLVRDCHAAGVRVIPWTANHPEDWERLLAAGCDGVITDVPGEAVEWMEGAGGGA